MEVLYWLEKIRVPILNEFMLLITQLGEETAFLVAALIVFWCVDKRRGYYILAVGFIGTMANHFLKLVCRVPRPWVLDRNFTILEQAREGATGYSFPSGHSQTAVGTFGAIAHTTGSKWVKWLSIAVAVLVPFSRMYVGVHTPWDVLAGAGVALFLVFALKTIAGKDDLKTMKLLLAGMLVMAVELLLYVEFWRFPEDMDGHNLESGIKNAYTMIGCTVGTAVVYLAEHRYVKFNTKAVWWAQILKVALGLGVVLAVKEGLRSPLEALCGPGGVYTARAVRYFLIVVVAGLIWPCTFRWFGKMGEKK